MKFEFNEYVIPTEYAPITDKAVSAANDIAELLTKKALSFKEARSALWIAQGFIEKCVPVIPSPED